MKQFVHYCWHQHMVSYYKIYLYITVSGGTWYDITNFQHETICRLLPALAHGIILQGLIHGMIFQTLTMKIYLYTCWCQHMV